jgi:hypothetical protein
MTYLEEIDYDIAQQEAKIRQDQEWLAVLKDRRERALNQLAKRNAPENKRIYGFN